ncbi:MAG: C40 family peptidase [Bacteroidia bacterium]
MKKLLALLFVVFVFYKCSGLFHQAKPEKNDTSKENTSNPVVTPSPIPELPLPAPVSLPARPAADEPVIISRKINISSLLQLAGDLEGSPYQAGGTDPEGFDCSGFVGYVYAQEGLNLPRSSRSMAMYGRRIDRQDVQPGDLLFFTGEDAKSGEIGHVALVSGKKGKKIFIIHATNRGVVTDNLLHMKYYSERYLTATRPYEREE